MDIFARDARAMAKMREGVPLTAYSRKIGNWLCVVDATRLRAIVFVLAMEQDL